MIREAASVLVSQSAYQALEDATMAEIETVTAGRAVGYGWSGGKDSQALEHLMDRAGIVDCCFGMSDLEYQQFLVWVTDHMPHGLQIYNNGWNVQWLKDHDTWTFPQDAATAGKWFAGIQHTAQRKFCADRGKELLIVGRRRAEGNQCGDANGIYEGPDGVLRYAPLRNWSHAEVFACLHYHGNTEKPPFYTWPRGYRVGTHSWPARQWCNGMDHGYAEVFSIEPERVIEAYNAGVPSAVRWLDAQPSVGFTPCAG